MADIMAFIITIWAKEKLRLRLRQRLHPRLMPITDITIIEDTMEAITDIPDNTTAGKPIRKFNRSEDSTKQKIKIERVTKHQPLFCYGSESSYIPKIAK
jgi:hypothetical protein